LAGSIADDAVLRLGHPEAARIVSATALVPVGPAVGDEVGHADVVHALFEAGIVEQVGAQRRLGRGGSNAEQGRGDGDDGGESKETRVDHTGPLLHTKWRSGGGWR